MSTRGRAVAACLILMASITTGCGRTVAADGSLRLDDAPSRLCLDAGVAQVVAGSTMLTNTGTSPLTITGVEPVHAYGLAPGDAYVISEPDETPMTVGSPVPPDPDDPWASVAWPAKRAAVGVSVPPGARWQLFQVMTVVGPDAGFDHLQVSYSERGRERVATNQTSVGVTGLSPDC